MNNPNWKNPADYPSENCMDMALWAWEFLRRNDGYRNDFNEYWKYEKEKSPQASKKFWAIFEKYGFLEYGGLPAPEDTNPPIFRDYKQIMRVMDKPHLPEYMLSFSIDLRMPDTVLKESIESMVKYALQEKRRRNLPKGHAKLDGDRIKRLHYCLRILDAKAEKVKSKDIAIELDLDEKRVSEMLKDAKEYRDGAYLELLRGDYSEFKRRSAEFYNSLKKS